MPETLYQDPAFVDAPSDIGAPPSSGVGLAESAAPSAPDVATSAAPQLAPRSSPMDAMREEYAKSGTVRKIGLLLQEFGAGAQGHPSPLATAIEQRRKDKLLQLQEVKETTSALEHGVKLAQGLEGDARKQFIETYSQTMDQLGKGLGQTFKAAADRPDMVANMASLMPYLPEPLKLKAKVDPQGFLKDIGHGEGLKALDAAKNSYYMNKATSKAKTLLTHAQQLGVPDELVQEYQQNPTASTFRKMMDLSNDPRVKFSPDEETGVNAHADIFYQSLGMMSPKGEEAIREDKAKKATPSAAEAARLEEEKAHHRKTEEQGDARLKLEKLRMDQERYGALTEVTIDGKNVLVVQDKKNNRVIDANGNDVTDKIAPKVVGAPLDPGRISMALQAHKDITDARKLIFDDKGELNRSVLAAMDVPGTKGVGTDGRKAYSAIENAVAAKLRGETGAATNPSEIENTAARFRPTMMDTKESAKYKMDRLQEFMGMTLDQLKESYHISQATYDKAKGGSRGDRGEGEALPMPANKSELVPNQDYKTSRGVATWNGTAFVAKKK